MSINGGGGKIPRVASASLVLGAMAGCGGKDPTPTSVANLACRVMQECSPTQFKTYYTSVDQCAKANADEFDFTSKGAACQKAALDYYNCYYGALVAAKDTCSSSAEYDAFRACAQKGVAFENACY